MPRARLSILFALIFIIFPGSRDLFGQNRVKTIVVFIPMNASMPSFQNFLEGFWNALGENYNGPCNLQVEYLDMEGFNEDYLKTIVSQYNEKDKDIKLDLIVTVGPFSYQVLKKHGLRALETTPTIRIELEPQVEGTPGISFN